MLIAFTTGAQACAPVVKAISMYELSLVVKASVWAPNRLSVSAVCGVVIVCMILDSVGVDFSRRCRAHRHRRTVSESFCGLSWSPVSMPQSCAMIGPSYSHVFMLSWSALCLRVRTCAVGWFIGGDFNVCLTSDDR